MYAIKLFEFKKVASFKIKNLLKNENKTSRKKKVTKNKILIYFLYFFFEKKTEIFDTRIFNSFKNIFFLLKTKNPFQMRFSWFPSITLFNKKLREGGAKYYFFKDNVSIWIEKEGRVIKNEKLSFEKRLNFFSFKLFVNFNKKFFFLNFNPEKLDFSKLPFFCRKNLDFIGKNLKFYSNLLEIYRNVTINNNNKKVFVFERKDKIFLKKVKESIVWTNNLYKILIFLKKEN